MYYMAARSSPSCLFGLVVGCAPKSALAMVIVRWLPDSRRLSGRVELDWTGIWTGA